MPVSLAQMGANLPILPTGPTVNVAGLVKPNVVTGDNMQASLIDLGQLGNMFGPDANIIGQFDASQGIVNNQIGGAKTESDRMRNVSNEATNQIAPMAQNIYGGLSQNMGKSTGAAAQAAQNVLGQNFGDVAQTQLAHFQTASDLGRAGFEQQAPLLQAGFNELHNRRSAALDQLNAQLSQEILGQRTGYLTGLEQRKQGALSEAAAFNTTALNQANEYNAAAAARRAEAERQRVEAERQRAFQAQQAAQERADRATQARLDREHQARENEKTRAISREEKEKEKGPWTGTWNEDFKFYNAGSKEVSLERGASLVAIEGGRSKVFDKLSPDAKKWVQEQQKKLGGKAPDQILAELQKSDKSSKWPQAASLLLFDTIGPSGIDYNVLGSAGTPGKMGHGVQGAHIAIAGPPVPTRPPAPRAPKPSSFKTTPTGLQARGY